MFYFLADFESQDELRQKGDDLQKDIEDCGGNDENSHDGKRRSIDPDHGNILFNSGLEGEKTISERWGNGTERNIQQKDCPKPYQIEVKRIYQG